MLRDIFSIFATNLIVNLSTIIIVAIAPWFLSTEGLSQFVLIIAATMFGHMVLDFGLNISAVKKYAEARNSSYLSILLTSKFVILVISLLSLPFMLSGGKVQFWAVAVLCAATMNWWTGLRTFEQAKQNYDAYSKANLKFAISRLFMGLIGLTSGDWLITSLAFFVGPALVVLIFEYNLVTTHLVPIKKSYIISLFKYSAFLHLDSIFHGAAMYLPQVFIASRLGATEIGTFGLIMSFAAPLSLVNASLRAYLLPRICTGDIQGRTLLVNPKFPIGLLALLLATGGGLMLASAILDFLYGANYPQLSKMFVVYMAFSILSITVSLFNIEVHRLGMIRLYATIRGISFTILLFLLWQYGTNFQSIVWIASTMFLAVEFLQAVNVRWFASKEFAAKGKCEIAETGRFQPGANSSSR